MCVSTQLLLWLVVESEADLEPSVFVNGRGRPEIMADMQARIERGNIVAEREAAIHVGHAFSIFQGVKTHRCLLKIGRLRHSYGP